MSSQRAVALVHSTHITKKGLSKSTYYVALAIDGLFTKTGPSSGASVAWNFRYEFPCTPATLVRFRIVKTSILLNDVEAGEGAVAMNDVYAVGGLTGTVAIRKKNEIIANLEYDLRLLIEAPGYQYPGGPSYAQIPASMIQPVTVMIGDYQKGFNPPQMPAGYQMAGPQPQSFDAYQKGPRQPQVVNRTIGLDDIRFLSLIYRTADGTTEVHNSRILSTNQPVTVKITHCTNLDKFNSVQKEGMIMCRMTHENVCKCFESLLDNREGRFDHWLVMECIDGVNLGVEIQRRGTSRQTWTEDELKRHTGQLIDAFAYMQSLSVCHSDIKPDNLVLNSAGVIKVIDFGLSLAGYQGQFERAAAFRVGGTPNFFSPVQFEAFKAYREGRNPQSIVQHNPVKSDVFSLGLVFLSMATLRFIENLNDPSRPGLQQTLTDLIRTLPGGPWLKDLLSAMLVIEECDRSDFAILKKLGYANSE